MYYLLQNYKCVCYLNALKPKPNLLRATINLMHAVYNKMF